MKDIDIDFDIDSLREIVYGMNLLRNIANKVVNAKAINIDLKYSQRYNWLLSISRKIFLKMIKEDKDIYISNEGSKIKKIIADIDELYYEDHLERSLNIHGAKVPQCCICEGCEECESFVNEYFSRFSLCERRIKFNNNIRVNCIEDEFLKYIPKLLDDTFLARYLVYEIYADYKNEEVVMRYVDEKSQYFGQELGTLDIAKGLNKMILEAVDPVRVFENKLLI